MRVRVLVGTLALAAAAVGFPFVANADVGPMMGLGNGGAPTSPIPFLECDPGFYENSSGVCVERPDQNISGATAVCCDGSDSHSQHRSGTCSGHGGVCQWLTPSAWSGAPPIAGNQPSANAIDPDSRLYSLLTDPTAEDHGASPARTTVLPA